MRVYWRKSRRIGGLSTLLRAATNLQSREQPKLETESHTAHQGGFTAPLAGCVWCQDGTHPALTGHTPDRTPRHTPAGSSAAFSRYCPSKAQSCRRDADDYGTGWLSPVERTSPCRCRERRQFSTHIHSGSSRAAGLPSRHATQIRFPEPQVVESEMSWPREQVCPTLRLTARCLALSLKLSARVPYRRFPIELSNDPPSPCSRSWPLGSGPANASRTSLWTVTWYFFPSMERCTFR